MTEQWNGVPDGCLALAKQIVHAYTRDDRREPNSRDIEIARMIWTEITAREAASAEAMRVACEERARLAVSRVVLEGPAAILKAIRTAPTPHASALARALADAEKRGMERAESDLRFAKDLLHCLLTNDPDDIIADGGVTVLMQWRKDAERMFTAEELATIRNAAAQESEQC